MSAMLEVSRPTPLRLLGFVFTALGGLLVAVGATMAWATVGIRSDAAGVLDTTSPGLDLAAGRVALGLGVALLLGIVAMRIVSSVRARRLLGLAILVGASAALAIGVATIVGAQDRFAGYATEDLAQDRADALDIPVAQARHDVEAVISELGRVDVELGLWLVVAGGAVGIVGALLDVVWAGRVASAPDQSTG